MAQLARFIPIVLLLLAACGSPAPGGAATEPASPEPPTRPPGGAATELASPEPPTRPPGGSGQGVLVTYEKSGGIAGIDETLTVRGDGSLELIERGGAAKQAQLAPADLDRLRGLLASPEFAALRPLYKAAGADFFTYTITASVNGGTQTVVTQDGAQHPAVLSQVLEELERLRAQVR